MKTDPWVLLAANNDGGWNQKWNIKSNVARLLKHEDNPTQQWEADYVGLNYDFALLPGFPGSKDDGCLSSIINKQLAKSAMYSCDESMSLLIGSQTSVGTLRSVANLVNEKGPQRMPGECCMDAATNSDFFGYRVSVSS